MWVRKRAAPLGSLFAVVVGLRPPLADHSWYNKVVELRTERGDVACTHRHDWSHKTEASRAKMIEGRQDVFGPDNDYASLECVSKSTGAKLFKAPVPALTVVWISADERYIVG